MFNKNLLFFIKMLLANDNHRFPLLSFSVFYTQTTYNNRNFGMRARGQTVIYFMYHLKWQLEKFFFSGNESFRIT